MRLAHKLSTTSPPAVDRLPSCLNRNTVNRDTWNSLPEFVRPILRDAASKWADWQIEENEARNAVFPTKMKAEGVQEFVLPPEERRRWAAMLPNIGKEWASSLEQRGLPGMTVLKAYMDELRALRNVEIACHWDRE